MGQFALMGLLTILLAFTLLVMGISTLKGSFDYEDIKSRILIFSATITFGSMLTLIP